jgi:hypothetical protein
MQYRRHIVFLLFATLASTVVVRSPGAETASAPETTQYVARLQNFGTLVAFLNLASGTVRLVAVVEPSSPSSDAVITALQSIMDNNPSKRLRGYVVWTRVSADDTEMRALSRSNGTHDRRLVHFWDGGALVAESYRGVLGSGDVPTTGVVLLYDTDARLALTPPAPSMWLSVNPKLTGNAQNASQLAEQANAMVRRVEAKVTDGTAQNP